MEEDNQKRAVRFQNVKFSTQNITLLSGKSNLASVEKNDVRKITLKYGFQSERPVIQVIFGFAIITS